MAFLQQYLNTWSYIFNLIKYIENDNGYHFHLSIGFFCTILAMTYVDSSLIRSMFSHIDVGCDTSRNHYQGR